MPLRMRGLIQILTIYVGDIALRGAASQRTIAVRQLFDSLLDSNKAFAHVSKSDATE